MPTIKRIVKSTAAESAVTYETYIHGLEWYPSASGQKLVVTDNNGNELMRSEAQGDASNGNSSYVCWKIINAITNGVVVTMIGGGFLNTTVG